MAELLSVTTNNVQANRIKVDLINTDCCGVFIFRKISLIWRNLSTKIPSHVYRSMESPQMNGMTLPTGP